MRVTHLGLLQNLRDLGVCCCLLGFGGAKGDSYEHCGMSIEAEQFAGIHYRKYEMENLKRKTACAGDNVNAFTTRSAEASHKLFIAM